MKRSLLLTVAAAGVLSLAGNTLAADAILSPKAQSLADSFRKFPATMEMDLNLATHRPSGNAKAWNLAHSFRKTPSPGPTVDLAHGPRPTLSPKDPRYEQEFRRLQEIRLAPLK